MSQNIYEQTFNEIRLRLEKQSPLANDAKVSKKATVKDAAVVTDSTLNDHSLVEQAVVVADSTLSDDSSVHFLAQVMTSFLYDTVRVGGWATVKDSSLHGEGVLVDDHAQLNHVTTHGDKREENRGPKFVGDVQVFNIELIGDLMFSGDVIIDGDMLKDEGYHGPVNNSGEPMLSFPAGLNINSKEKLDAWLKLKDWL